MNRSGYTLVELLVVMSVNSVLMGAAAVLLGMLLRSEHLGRRHFEGTSAMTRLAELLRADIAAANEASIEAVTPDDKPQGAATRTVDRLRLVGGDARLVEYWREGERVRRAEHEEQTLSRREAYALPGLTTVDFVLSPDQLVSARVSLRERNGTPDVWTVEARLGKDQRLLKKETP